MGWIGDAEKALQYIGSVREGTVSLEKAKQSCVALKAKVLRLQKEVRDLKTENPKRTRRVAEFYSNLSRGSVALDNVFEHDLQPEAPTGEPPCEEVVDSPSDFSQPVDGANAPGESSPTTVVSSLSMLEPDFWNCIGSASLDQQVVLENERPEVIQRRYTALTAAGASEAMFDDANIPDDKMEGHQNVHAPDMKDVFKLLKAMHSLARQTSKTIATIATFEKEFMDTSLHLGVTQNIVMHLYRGQPYQKEFIDEDKALDDQWKDLKDARDEVDKNTKDAGESLMDGIMNASLQLQEEMNAKTEDISNNIIKIQQFLSMTLVEQAQLRAITAREKINSAVRAFGKPEEKAASIAYLKDVCEEYRGNGDVLNWVHPKLRTTAMFFASANNYSECVEILGDCKADVNLRLPSSDGWSCLTIAASRGSADCVAILMKQGADVNLPNAVTGQAALHYAVMRGDVAIVGIILESAAPGAVDLNLACCRGLSPIHSGLDLLASQSAETLTQGGGVLQCVSALMDAGASVQPEALAFAAKKSRCNAALRLMTTHAKFDSKLVNAYVEGHGTILYGACEGRNHEALEILIAAGADANKIPGKRKSSSLIFAVGCNDQKAVEILLGQPTLNLELEVLHSERKTCLFIAVEKNFLSVLSILVNKLKECQADKRAVLLNSPDKLGRTPLLLACQMGLLEHVELLVTVPDCDVNYADLQGKTPAFTATEQGFYGILAALTKANCDLRRPCGADSPLAWIRAKTDEFEYSEEPGEYEFEDEADDDDSKYMQIRQLLEKRGQPVEEVELTKCYCAIA